MTIRFDVTSEDAELIHEIVARAYCIYKAQTGVNLDRRDLEMDLTACHANGTPLRLADLLVADDFNFAHDVFGIREHIDRDDTSPTAGRMLGHFLPRFYDSKATK